MSLDLGCPWLEQGLYLDTRTYNDLNDPVSGDVAVKSCCRTNDRGISFTQLESNRNNPEYNFDNLKNTLCSRCHNDEQVHGESMRTRAIDIKKRIGVDPERKIRFLQFTFSNFCNFKCKYCSPSQSTSWNDDVDISEGMMKVFMDKSETFSMEDKMLQLLENVDLSELKSLGVTGGEPFMTRKFQDLMELINRKANPEKMFFWLNTNASIFPKQKMIDLLSQFGMVDLRLSNESVGKLSEYIRNGSKWNEFDTNAKKWLEASAGTGIKVQCQATHNVWSVNQVNDFYSWAKTTGIDIFDSESFSPIYANVSAVLNKDQLKECYDQLESMPDSNTKNYVRKMLNKGQSQDQHEKALAEFKKFTRIFDTRTPYTLEEVNPQLYNWTHS